MIAKLLLREPNLVLAKYEAALLTILSQHFVNNSFKTFYISATLFHTNTGFRFKAKQAKFNCATAYRYN